MSRLPLIAAAAFCLLAAPAAAQQVTLSMRDGLVTLDAKNVSVRQILNEWARVGRVVVVNGEKVAGAPVTLQLAGVPESRALDTILRGVAGYLVSARPGTADPSQARFDKVVILAASAAPAAPPPGPPGPAGLVRQPIFQPGPQAPDPDDGFDEVPDDPGARPSAFQPGGIQRPAVGVQMSPAIPPGMPQGVPRVQAPGSNPPVGVAPQPGAPGQTPVGRQTAPGNPFGSVTSGAPGSVAPPPAGSAIPLSPTNPGVLQAVGGGPAVR